MSTRHPPSSHVMFVSGIGSTSADGALSSPITGDSPLSAIIGCLLSPVTWDSPLSAVSGRLSSLTTSSGPLSTVFDRLLSLFVNDGPLYTVFGYLLSLITSSDLLSTIFGSGFLFPVPPASSWTLFLTSILSCTRYSSLVSLSLFYSFLPSLPILLTYNPIPLTEKRLFNQTFITQMPIISI